MSATVDVELGGFVVRVDFLDRVEELGRLIPFPLIPTTVSVVEQAKGFDQIRIGLVVMKIENLVDPDWFGFSFYDYIVDLSRSVGRLDRIVGKLPNENVVAVLLAGALDAGGQDHTVSDYRVVHPFG